MTFVPILIAILMLLLLAGINVFERWWRRRRFDDETMSPVSQQHFDIFQTGELNETAVAIVTRRFRDLFARGDEVAVEASLRPGTQFIFQVRALAEIGTEAAAVSSNGSCIGI